MKLVRYAIVGAAGRMGRRIVALASSDASLTCANAIESQGNEHIGRDMGDLAGIGPIPLSISAELNADFDVLIDFSTADATGKWLSECRKRRRPMIIGTTGHDARSLDEIRAAAGEIAVLKAPNMSVGVNLMIGLVEELARSLDAKYDVEITEAHHRFKADAPSGTAIALRDAVLRGRGVSGETVHGRTGQTGARPAGQIGMHSLRIGDTVGDHTVSFGALGETISISHSAHSRDTFAAGALLAARWIVGKPAGLYGMNDVLRFTR